MLQIRAVRGATTATLSLVDLAGSERCMRADTSGERLREARKINQSLHALSKCIHARVEGTYANYRESKLSTRRPRPLTPRGSRAMTSHSRLHARATPHAPLPRSRL